MAFNFLELKEPFEVEVIYTGQLKDVGSFHKNVFTFRRTKDDSVFHLWAFLQLKNGMIGIPFQSHLKLVYLGKGKLPEMKHEAHLFRVEVLGLDNKGDTEI